VVVFGELEIILDWTAALGTLMGRAFAKSWRSGVASRLVCLVLLLFVHWVTCFHTSALDILFLRLTDSSIFARRNQRMKQLEEMFCIFVSSTTTQKYIIILILV
jgi:hypothetical protein